MDPTSIGALTKVASIRAVGLVLDEIAVNTSMLQDVDSKRKIPAVAKVMAGSFLIKMLVIPGALLLNTFAPGLILPLLTFGGLHLASEGVNHVKEAMEERRKEKEAKEKGIDPKKDELQQTPAEKQKAARKLENNTIKKVLVIDGLLSVEITVMTLPILMGVGPLAAGAVLAMTGGIRTAWMYSLIGSIINMPRMGEWLKKREGTNPVVKAARSVGNVLSKVNPYIIKGFEVAGTLALLMIGGGLLVHGIPGAEHILTGALGHITANPIVTSLLTRVADTVVGLSVGAVARVPLEKLYEGIGKGVGKIFKPLVTAVQKSRKKGPAKENTPAAPKERVEAAVAPALQSAPDVKAALNEAAVKTPAAPEQDNTPAPEAKPEVKAEQPKPPAPPKAA